MAKQSNEDAVDRAVRDLQQLLDKSQHLDTATVRAIADQFRADAALARTMRQHRHVYDAISEYFEHAADYRDKENDTTGSPIGDAVRALVQNLDDDESSRKS
ncbi:MAG: hypothetical protein ABJ215_15765 [Alphaproteobacteria bacterium]